MADFSKLLTPSEQISKLRSLKKEKEKEIKQAEKIIGEAQEELSVQQEWEEKLIIKTQKELSKRRSEELDVEVSDTDENEDVEEKIDLQETNLEERLKSVNVGQRDVNQDLINNDYILNLSQVPAQSLYQEMTNLYDTVKEKGYVSPDDQRNMVYINSAMERKLEDVNTGSYTLSEQVSKTAILSKEIGDKVNSMYRS